MDKPTALDSLGQLARENAELRYQLEEAQELIQAIRTGAVDALAVQTTDGPRIFTLQGADQEYRTLIEEMNEGALMLSDDATILYCNASLARLLDCALEEVIGRSFLAFVPADFRSSWQQLWETGWAGRGKGELPLRTRPGVLVPFSLSMNVLVFHEMPALAVIVTDLSAQREIETIRAVVAEQNEVIGRTAEELEKQQAARRAVERAAAEATRVMEGIPQIAWTANPQGQNTYLNRRWFDYAGPAPQPPQASWLSAYIYPADLPLAAERWAESLRTEEPLEVECRIRHRDGQYRWMLGRALPSRNAEGQIIQWIGTYTDIHEHKLALERIAQAQRQLRDNNEQLTRANVDLDNFIYTASHDLKAPISNIEGLLHALLVELPTGSHGTGEVDVILNLMQDSVNRFKKTIEQLTDVSKLQKEHGKPTEIADLAAVVADVCLDLQPLIQETGAVLDVENLECRQVVFSEKNLRSVVYNLLSNALKYRAAHRAPQVWLRCHPAGEFVVLEVQDNGLGIDLSSEQKLFGMFQRLHDHVEGSGIGLYMVKKMVENAGGRIEVSSRLGHGSTFSVYFAV
ncbi:PAS domain-containing sensor histidine kinase [Hymenobacter saemangeumensis]|uniref:histidine kinase n=1 Tax=Hymenobacter saemangeumensis TaxID=1084522 RepID=A0ABP8IQD7_9BACT